MSFTTSDVLLEVRELMLDTLDAPYRYSDAFILRKTNLILKRMVVARPDLFCAYTNIVCAAGALQSAPADSVRIMDVTGSQTGTVVREINQDVLDLAEPTWESTSGVAKNWMRYPRDPNRFYVWPAPQAGDSLSIMYAQSPPNYTSGATIVLQDAYFPAVVDGVCWLMESQDAEHIESGRAKQFLDSYREQLGLGLTTRKITDTDTAGQPPEEAV